jgi:D-3-phosphoglycerate dehydrogenase
MQIAGDRHLSVTERHERRSSRPGIGVEIESSQGLTAVEGAVVLDKPRLLQVDGIHCEAPLDGNLIYCKNYDVPGVIGFIGTVLGRNGVNIANFSLGREEKASQPGQPLEAMSVIETDQPVPDSVLAELLDNPGMKLARAVPVSSVANAHQTAS